MTPQEKLQSIMTKMGWPQHEVAPKLQITQSRVSQILNGDTPGGAVEQLLDQLYQRICVKGITLKGFIPGKEGHCTISPTSSGAAELTQRQFDAYKRACLLCDPINGGNVGRAIECLENAGFEVLFE